MNNNLLFTSVAPQANQNWLFTWDLTDAAYYRVILFGRVLSDGVVTTGSYLYRQAVPMNTYIDNPPPLEVVEETNLAQSEINPPFIILQWYNDSIYNVQVSYYQVQQYNTVLSPPAWVNGPVIKEVGNWVYSQTTPVLSDGNTYNFRVLAIGTIDQVSCALPFQVNMVCCPVLDEGSIVIDYDSIGQNVTVTAA